MAANAAAVPLIVTVAAAPHASCLVLSFPANSPIVLGYPCLNWTIVPAPAAGGQATATLTMSTAIRAWACARGFPLCLIRTNNPYSWRALIIEKTTALESFSVRYLEAYFKGRSPTPLHNPLVQIDRVAARSAHTAEDFSFDRCSDRPYHSCFRTEHFLHFWRHKISLSRYGARTHD